MVNSSEQSEGGQQGQLPEDAAGAGRRPGALINWKKKVDLIVGLKKLNIPIRY